jgi:pyruvate,water dikinase
MSNWLTDQKSERPVGLPNYAVIGHEYRNINARMDFHFTMIDAVCGLEPRNNHLKFRFKGGGTQMQKRIRRVRTIGLILEKYGFLVDIREDLVTGTLRGGYQEAILERLVVVGRLLGFTRLLDAVMVDDKLIELSANAFIQGDYSLSTLLAQGIIHAEKKK